MAGVDHLTNPLVKTSILSVAIPEIKKRRVPNKFYVYKIVVQWSNGQTITVYRRYSNFFDFWCKLKELHTCLLSRSIRYADHPVPLPEMPGKIFLGRSQTHQVAQRRQKKLEEFCQQLIKMPEEVSQSTVVYGFFSLWPDDSISAMEVRRNTAIGHRVIKPDMTSSVQIHSPSDIQFQHPLLSAKSTSTLSSAIPLGDVSESFSETSLLKKQRSETFDLADFEDEREADPPYRAISNYSRLDAQQLDLREGQVVRVIEKHDTGWWMVEASFEQGYVPASHLEPLDDKEKSANHDDALADLDPDEYVVLEQFDSTADDEVSLLVGDLVTVVSIKMDGWWKIKKGSETGYAPSAILRKKGVEEIAKTLTRESQIFLNDVTLLRSSRRFPPRHGSCASKEDVRALKKKSPTVAKDGGNVGYTGSAVAECDSPRAAGGRALPKGLAYQLNSYDIPKGCRGPGLPPGIDRRYEWCNPVRETPKNPVREVSQNHYKMDTREEPASRAADATAPSSEDLSIYQVPRSIAVNSNLSNNQDHSDGDGVPNTRSKVDIYSSLLFSPPPDVNVYQTPIQQQGEATTATTTPDRPSPKVLRTFTSTSSTNEPISTIDPELLVSLNMEEGSHVPSGGSADDNSGRAIAAEAGEQSPLVPPPRIPRLHTVASPAVQESAVMHKKTAPVSPIRKPPPPPPPVYRKKPKSLHSPHATVEFHGQPRREASHNPLAKQLSDPAATVLSVQNRPLPSPPLEKRSHLQPGVASQSPTRIHRAPPPPPPFVRRQARSAEKSSNHGAVVAKPVTGKAPVLSTTSMKERPLPSVPQQGRSEMRTGIARPLPGLPSSGQSATPPQVPKAAPTEYTMRERSDTVPVQLTDTFGEYWTMNSAIPTLHRLSGASTDNEYVAIGEFTLQPDSTADGAAHEYVDMDEGNVLQQMTPSSTTEGARNTAEVVSVQSHTDEGPSSSSQKIERNGVSPPTSRVLSTEPIDESIASRNVPAQSTPPPPRDRLPPPKPAPFLLSEDAGDAGYDPKVEYQNVTSDMLNVGEVQLYQNVVHPESEYKNCQFVPPKKPTGHLGTYIATSSAEQTMEECIRVRTHDRGELLAESKEWWYMRIGKEEGWTPKEIWEPTVETKALMKAGILGPYLSKKRSFTTADGVKPRAPPPKPRRVFEHIQETSDETLDRTRASTAVERRHKPTSPSFRPPTDLHNNRSSSPGNGATSPSNGTTSPSNMHRPTTSVSTKMQLRPLPETPTETQAAQYVCDVSLSLELQPWFYKAMDRPEAEKLLRMAHVRNREFIVRERASKPGYYALSVRHHYSIRHFNIDPNPNGSYSIGQHTFDSLPDIILHYQTHSLFMEGSGSNQSPVTIVRPAKLLRSVERQRSNTSIQ